MRYILTLLSLDWLFSGTVSAQDKYSEIHKSSHSNSKVNSFIFKMILMIVMCYVKSSLQLNDTLLFDSHTLIGEELLTNLCWLLLQFVSQKSNELWHFMYKHAYIHFYIFGGEKDKNQLIKTANILKDLYTMYEGNYPRQFVFKKIYNLT